MAGSVDVSTVPQGVSDFEQTPCAQLTVEIETFTHDAVLSGLESDWNELLNQSHSAGIFLSWEWLSTCLDYFGKGDELLVLKACDPHTGEVVGMLPLMLKKRPFRWCGFFRELSFPGSRQTAPDHLDLLAQPGREREVATAFVEALKHHSPKWDLLVLDAVASNSAIGEALRDKFPIKAIEERESACPCLELPETWDEFYSGLDRKVRSNLKRRSKKLDRESDGKITFHQVSHVEELDEALRDLYRLHQQVRRTRGETGAFHSDTLKSFHRTLAEKLLQNDRLRLSFLKVGGKPIAVAYCFRFGDVISFYQTGYDQEWSKYGPGSAIILQMIRNAIEEGARVFDFLRGGESYKSQWTSQSRRDSRIRLAFTRKGKWSLHVWRLLRKVKQRLKSG